MSGPMGGPMGGRRGPAGHLAGDRAKDFKGTVKRLFSMMGRYRVGLAVFALSSVLAAAFTNLGPRVLGFATNAIQEGALAGAIDFGRVGRILVLLGGCYLCGAVFTYLQHYLMAGVAQKTMYDMRRQVDQKLRRLPLRYFDGHAYGDILSRVTNDVDTVSNSLQQGMNQVLNAVLSLSVILVMMVWISPVLTLIALLTLPLIGLLTMQVVKRSQGLFRGQQQSLGTLNGYIEEMYTGHNIIKAYGREERVLERFEEINEARYRYSWKANFISGLIMPLSNLISNLGYVLVCVVGGAYVVSGRLLVGDIQSFIQYLRNFSQPITQIANLTNMLQSTVAAAERVFQFLDEDEEVPDTTAPRLPAKREGAVEFSHLRFGYTPDRILIRDLNLKVAPGQMVAIVGPTGAGKTTLVNLLLRFYELDGGTITVDGVDITQMTRPRLREYFGMVLQDTWLFKGTILENIRYGRLTATDDQVIQAAKAAHAHEFIQALPGGYAMELNEDASNISQGQRQLLTIARAILADPPIMILDEATSSVDTRTESAIQMAMSNLMEGRTSFVIAHRLSTIRDADNILVMNHGDIVETGTHAQLIAKGGFYADLYNSQFNNEAT